jgi:hypothetical protein
MAFANSFILGVTIVTGALIPLALHVVESPQHPLRFGARLGNNIVDKIADLP